MAIVANTFTRYSAIGIREDLSNVIYNISPEETPFISNIGRENVKNTYFEWQTDSLAAASASNAALEGDDVSSFTAVVSSRIIVGFSSANSACTIRSHWPSLFTSSREGFRADP